MKKITFTIFMLTLITNCYANDINVGNNIDTNDFNTVKDNLESTDFNSLNESIYTPTVDSNPDEINSNNLSLDQQNTISTAQNSASDDTDCAIWICLPFHFPDGCSNAKSRFKKRIRKGKSPLPDFSSCLVSNVKIGGTYGASEMSSKDGIAAYIPRHKEKGACIKSEIRYGATGGYQVCTQYEYIELDDSYVKDTPCVRDYSRGTTTPANCASTMHYVEILMDNNKLGDTYYY